MTEPTGLGKEPITIDKVDTVREVQAYMREILSPEEMLKRDGLEAMVVDVLCDTELPENFQITEIGSVKNETTRTKYEILYNTPGLLEFEFVPNYMTTKYPLNFENEVIEKAPWVNMIHAWMKCLNYTNTLAAIQRGDVEKSDIPKVVATIADGLYKFTTESDGDYFSRTSKQFKNQEIFTETIMRESGTKGVNMARHVSLAEMKYILSTMKRAFAKD